MFNFAFVDEHSKREIRRKLLKAVAIPGYQVPFASRELPIARGWGTGGLQVTMAIIGPDDVLKVIDQGCDGVVNAVNLRNLLVKTTGVATTFATGEATIIQTRHRLPEQRLRAGQILVLQVPYPEPLRLVEPSERITRRMHGERDYSLAWLDLYERVVRWGEITVGASYPALVNGRYIMCPSPIPRWDLPKLHLAEALHLFGAGREKRLYAVPPYTRVEPLEFEDYRFRVESFAGQRCRRCGSADSYLDELYDAATGETYYACSDSAWCEERRRAAEAAQPGSERRRGEVVA
jgi:alpha-D-ribose 1-methylphosphonate 5-phosphate C-P lyase